MIPEIAYSFLPENFFVGESEEYDMEKDAVISVIGGQSLRLRKIHNFLDPLVLTYRK